MPRRLRLLVLLLVFVSVVAGCTTTSSSSGSSRSSGSSTRCLDRGSSGGQGSVRASEEPDRPIFFLFCVQSP